MAFVETKITDNLTSGLIKAVSALKASVFEAAQAETERSYFYAIKNLSKAMASYTPKTKKYVQSSGDKLKGAIYFDTHGVWQGRKIVFFADIDTSKAPYAFWVENEHGRFPGYKFMETTYKEMSKTFKLNIANEVINGMVKRGYILSKV